MQLITPRNLVPALLLLCGCGSPQADYSELNLVDVTGTVSVSGTPIADAVLVFKDAETDGEAYGLTDSNGNYRIRFDSVEFGILPGKKSVSISTTRKVLGLNVGLDEEDGEATPEGEEGEGETIQDNGELIPDTYVGNGSPLAVTIDNQTSSLDFDLNPDGSTTSAK